jgi:hypothetical protein
MPLTFQVQRVPWQAAGVQLEPPRQDRPGFAGLRTRAGRASAQGLTTHSDEANKSLASHRATGRRRPTQALRTGERCQARVDQS